MFSIDSYQQLTPQSTIHFVHDSWLPFYEQPSCPHLNQESNNNHKQPSSSRCAKDVKLYKTEFCRNWSELGHCRYDKKCRYAHGDTELRILRRHSRYKTQICRAYFEDGSCPYGIRCNFIHDTHASRSNNVTVNNSNPGVLKRRDSIGSFNSTLSSFSSLSSNSNQENAYSSYFYYSPKHNENQDDPRKQQHNKMLNSAKEYFLMKQEQQRSKLAAETVYTVTWGCNTVLFHH